MARYSQYAPSFVVIVDGEPLPTEMRAAISSVRYQDGIEGADRVEITLANQGLQWLDHPLLAVDNGFELKIGYAPDPLERVFVGEITGVNASFPSGGMPTVTVVAHDFLQRLTAGTKNRAFALSLPCIGNFPLPDPLIADLVGLTNLLIPVVDPAGAALSFLTLLLAFALLPPDAQPAVRMQIGESDFDLISGLARENGWDMFVDHTMEPQGYVLRFQFLIQDYAPSVTLKWGESLIDFAPRISTVGQVTGVSTRIWFPTLKMEFVVILGWDFDRAAFDIKVFPGLGDLEDLMGPLAQGVIDVNNVSLATAPKKILGELLPRLNNRLTGGGTAIGNPDIKAGRVIQLDGLGEQFGGLYRVTSATHTIDGSGYRTSFEVRKEVWFGSIPTPKGARGLVRAQGQRVG